MKLEEDKMYTVVITEILSKDIRVKASGPEQARKIVRDRYYNEKIILSADDLFETKIETLDNTIKKESNKKIKL